MNTEHYIVEDQQFCFNSAYNIACPYGLFICYSIDSEESD